MSPLNFKDFLTSGACLQTGPDTFKVLMGPFEPYSLEEVQGSEPATFLYKAKFWDFLKGQEQQSSAVFLKASAVLNLNREDFIGLLLKEETYALKVVWDSVQETGFKEQFEWSLDRFKEGNLKKTVPIILQKGKAQLSLENKKWLLLQLLQNKNFGWSYAYFENENGVIGHTPEILLDWDRAKQQAQTVALAGTVAISENAKKEISTDTKILQEHNYVIDDIQQKLAEFVLKKESTEVLTLKHLLHLQTRFSFPLKNLEDFLKSILRLHPTAAMGVFPFNEEALYSLSDFDLQQKRGLFASPFGFVDHDRGQIVVAIRNLIFSPGDVSLYSGCGVTADSVFESEILELENKRNSVKKILGLMND